MHTALFFEKETSSRVRCLLCPHRCVIAEGESGHCHARINSLGILYAQTYGVVSSLALDPIEKKPLAHFYPGSQILSFGSFGCNLSCLFCQNHEISQTGVPESKGKIPSYKIMTAEQLVRMALEAVPLGNIGIAYTYNEPLISYEFVYDTSVLVRDSGLKNVLVTNGYINSEPLAAILPFIDAMNIDLKAFTNSFYQKICGGKLNPVLETIAACVGRTHVEVTTLVIPGHNSAPDEIDRLSSALASISPDIPLHLNRHHSDYRMAEPAPIRHDELLVLASIARRHLTHVHCGNIS